MKKVFLMLLCLLLVGCASFDVTKMDNVKTYPPNNPADVEILTQEPARPYVVIAEIRAQGETISRQENMKERMKEKAAAMGADAIILKSDEEVRRFGQASKAVEDNQGYGVDINKMFTKKMKGKVIKFKQ